MDLKYVDHFNLVIGVYAIGYKFEAKLQGCKCLDGVLCFMANVCVGQPLILSTTIDVLD